MKLSSLIYAFATFTVALAADAEDNKESTPSPLVTIRITLQCRGNDCDVPPSTPVLTQIKDNVLHYTSPANYTTNSTEPQFQGRTTIGELTLNKSLAGTHDFRVDGDHLFKGNDQAEHPGSLQTQVYNIACTASLPPKNRDHMSKEVYEFDLQNKIESGLWPLEDGIQVKCWKSLPKRVTENDRFDNDFHLKIGSRCDGGEDHLEECKKNNRTLPFVSYMKSGLMVGTTNQDLDSELDSSLSDAGDMIQLGELDFDYPTLDNITQLPVPVIFGAGNFPGEEDRTFECEIRIIEQPRNKTELFQVGQVRSMGYFDIKDGGPGGGFGYCYETTPPPIDKTPV